MWSCRGFLLFWSFSALTLEWSWSRYAWRCCGFGGLLLLFLILSLGSLCYPVSFVCAAGKLYRITLAPHLPRSRRKLETIFLDFKSPHAARESTAEAIHFVWNWKFTQSPHLTRSFRFTNDWQTLKIRQNSRLRRSVLLKQLLGVFILWRPQLWSFKA